MGGPVDAISFVRISRGIHDFYTYYLNVLLPHSNVILGEKINKNCYYFNACNNVRYILYYTDFINSVAKLIVHSPVLWVS